jgi:hypothetical protein
MTLPQLAYEAYRAHTGGISLASGQPIPAWDALKPEIQEAWRASLHCVRVAIDLEDIKYAVNSEYFKEKKQNALAALPGKVQAELVEGYLA